MSDAHEGVEALVLAGARSSGDPLCISEGVISKAVIDIAGAPMLSHVLRALELSRLRAPIWVLGGDGENLEAASGGVSFQALSAEGKGPAGSLVAALDGPVGVPLLVTTADHPLLRPEMVAHFLAEAKASDADICMGFAKKATIEAAFPKTSRTYLPFGDKDLSGCNLFYLRTSRARQVLAYWAGDEMNRKHLWRVARHIGFIFLLQLFFSRGGNARVFELLSQRLGATIRPIIMPFAEAAVDVDNPKDLALVREIFAAREPQA